MATLALQAAGSALAGPLGAMVGATIGNQIDHRLLGSGRREGPRLGDLSIQGSRYGRPIPRVYGTMRVAGTLIWATDLMESEAVTGAKGQPDTVTYSYSASFAVLLSSRSAEQIGRIWADGKLLRGAQGDLKVGGKMRLLSGSEGQEVDPLIASLEGEAPAYRGCTLVVFEDLQLAEYGNRIPMLSFELVADHTNPDVGAILQDMSDNFVVSANTSPVLGYAAYGKSLREAARPLIDLHEIKLRQSGDQLVEADSPAVRVPSDEAVGCGAGRDRGGTSAPTLRARLPLSKTPALVSLDHYDAARDYQAGRASAHGDPAARLEVDIDAPLVIDADRARALAENRIRTMYRERERLEISCAPEYFNLRPGDRIRHGGFDWTVYTVEVVEGVVQVSARLAVGTGGLSSIVSDSGSVSSSPDVVVTPTQVSLLDLPDLGAGPEARMALAAGNASEGWKAVPVSWSAAGRSGVLSSAGRETIMGNVVQALGPGCALVPDRRQNVQVVLLDDGLSLLSTDDYGLQAGANLAMIGSELVQFRDVTPLGAGQYRLSHLLRGVRGTEWAMDWHADGETFVMVDQARLTSIPMDRAWVGSKVTAIAEGIADDSTLPVSRNYAGEALRPPSPAHLEVTIDPSGALNIEWIARSRLAWAWVDGHESGIGENSMTFLIELTGDASTVRAVTGATSHVLTPDQTADFAGQLSEVRVSAIGDLATSRPTRTTVQL